MAPVCLASLSLTHTAAEGRLPLSHSNARALAVLPYYQQTLLSLRLVSVITSVGCPETHTFFFVPCIALGLLHMTFTLYIKRLYRNKYILLESL